MAALMLGKRKDTGPAHNMVLTLIGASLLWVGWFGFNAGSATTADGRAGMAMLATQMATGAAALGWMLAEWFSKGKPSVLGIASGAVAGLVAITPASGFVTPSAAVAIGLAAGIVCYFAATSFKHLFGYDDSLDAFGVHGVGGILGALLTGVFASRAIGGVDGSLLTQAKGVLTTVVYGFVVSYAILVVIDKLIGLRVTEEQEREGLDISLHGESIE
jgi:Amt family ammonium transporter